MKVIRLAVVLIVVSLSQVVRAAEAPQSEGIDLRQLIEIFAERQNKRFIVDPRVSGRVVVAGIDPRKLSYEELQSVLSVYGFVTTPERNGTIEILPDANARQIPVPVVTDKARNVGAEDVVTKTLDVEPLNAVQLVPILRPMLPQYAHLAAHAETNSLIVVARQANVETLEAIIRDLQSDRSGPAKKLLATREPLHRHRPTR